MNLSKLFKGCLLLGVVAIGAAAWMIVAKKPGAIRQEISIGNPDKVPVVFVDFGKVYYGQTALRRLVVRNLSGHTLSLMSQTSCGCTQVRILKPRVPPDGRSVLDITYTELSDGVAAPARQEFLIYNATGRGAVPLMRGTVKAFGAKSLQFSLRKVHWAFVPGKLVRNPQFVIVRNNGSYPIKIRWNSRWSGKVGHSFFSIHPMEAELNPDRSSKFTFSPGSGISMQNRPETAVVFARARMQVRRRPSQVLLRFGIQVSASPEPVLQAIPGALVLSITSHPKSITSVVRLLFGTGVGKTLRILTVISNNSKLHAVLQGKKVQVSLRLPRGERFLEGDIIVVYSYKELKQIIDIPTFAYRCTPE